MIEAPDFIERIGPAAQASGTLPATLTRLCGY